MTNFRKNLIIICLLLGAISLGTFLRVYNIDQQTLWYDEILSAGMSEKNIGFMIGQAESILHYLFIKLALFFSYSTIAMKVPGIIFGIGTIILMFFLGKALKNYTVGIAASYLTAISPVLIYFSGEVRYYTYLVFFSALALLIFLHWFRAKEAWKGIVILVVFILPVLSHPLGGFLILGFWAYFLVLILYRFFCRFSKRKIENLPKSGLVAFYSSLFLFGGLGATILLSGRLDRLIGKLIGLPSKFGTVHYGTTFLGVIDKYLPYKNFVWDFFRFFSSAEAFAAWLLIAFFVLGLVYAFIKHRDLFGFAIITLAFILLIPLFIVHTHWWDHKYFLAFAPFFLIICALGVFATAQFFVKKSNAKIKVWLIPVITTALVVIYFFFGPIPQLQADLGNYHVNNYDWETTAKFMIESVSDGDMIVLSDNHMSQISFLYYFNNGPDLEYYPGERLAEEAGNSSYKKLFERFIPKHLRNNKNVQIETLQTFAAYPREKIDEMVKIHENGGNIWFISIAGYPYYSIKFTTRIVEEYKPGGIEILKLEPAVMEEPFWLEIRSKNHKIDYKIPTQLQDIYYLYNLTRTKDGLVGIEGGSVTHIFKFFEMTASGHKNEIMPKYITIGGNLKGDNNSRVGLYISANGQDYKKISEFSPGDFCEKIELDKIDPIWLSHMVWVRLEMESGNDLILPNLKIKTEERIPIYWSAGDIAKFSNPILDLQTTPDSTSNRVLHNVSTAGPYLELGSGKYEAVFSIMGRPAVSAQPTVIEVVQSGGGKTFAHQEIVNSTAGKYQEFFLPFEITEPTQIEARVSYNQKDEISFDYLVIRKTDE